MKSNTNHSDGRRGFRLAALFAALLLALSLIAGCAKPQPEEPAPLGETEIDPDPEAATQETFVATLYFCNWDQTYLMGEAREMDSPVNRQPEYTVLEQLLSGPDAESNGFVSLVNPDTRVLALSETDGILSVTLSEDFLDWPNRVTDSLSQQVVNKRKSLALYSIVNTMIEFTSCSRVQILVSEDGTGAGRRLRCEEVGLPGDSILEPLDWQGQLNLTPYNTADLIFSQMQRKDYQSTYFYLLSRDEGGLRRPAENIFVSESADMWALEAYTITDCVISYDGQKAMAVVSYTLRDGQSNIRNYTGIPMTLARERGIWKLSYPDFLRIFRPE